MSRHFGNVYVLWNCDRNYKIKVSSEKIKRSFLWEKWEEVDLRLHGVVVLQLRPQLSAFRYRFEFLESTLKILLPLGWGNVLEVLLTQHILQDIRSDTFDSRVLLEKVCLFLFQYWTKQKIWFVIILKISIFVKSSFKLRTCSSSKLFSNFWIYSAFTPKWIALVKKSFRREFSKLLSSSNVRILSVKNGLSIREKSNDSYCKKNTFLIPTWNKIWIAIGLKTFRIGVGKHWFNTISKRCVTHCLPSE